MIDPLLYFIYFIFFFPFYDWRHIPFSLYTICWLSICVAHLRAPPLIPLIYSIELWMLLAWSCARLSSCSTVALRFMLYCRHSLLNALFQSVFLFYMSERGHLSWLPLLKACKVNPLLADHHCPRTCLPVFSD